MKGAAIVASGVINRDLPTSVTVSALPGSDLCEVRTVTLSGEEYPEICGLFDQVRELQQEAWAIDRSMGR